MTALVCTKRLPPGRACRAVMRERIDALGRIAWECPRCQMREAGRCWQCGAPRNNDPVRGVYCPPCGHKKLRIAQTRHAQEPAIQRKRREYVRKRMRTDPEYKARRARNKREWLNARPEKKAEYARKAKEKYWQKKLANPLDTSIP